MDANVLWFLLLIAAVGAGCYYAGWRAATGYLTAASAVGELATTTARQAHDFAAQANASAVLTASFGAALDRTTAGMSSLQADAAKHAEAQDGRYKDVSDVLKLLFTGLERSGAVKAPSRTPARQVGEPPAPGD